MLIFDNNKLLEVIAEEESTCNRAIEDRNIDSLLTLFEGKEMLHSLCKMAGCEMPNGMINALAKHIELSSFPHLVSLRAKLEGVFRV